MSVFLLLLAAFFSGLIDGISGGGGLIQLPALLLLAPAGLGHAASLGTNKLAAFMGTSISAAIFARKGLIPWRLSLYSGAIACFSSFLGSKTVSLVAPNNFKPIVLVLLILVALYTFTKKDLGKAKGSSLTPSIIRALIMSFAIGFYDGFFGPGTGSFLIFVLVSWVGLNFLSASGSAKVINLFTNMGSLLYFVSTSNVLYQLALPMGLFNIAGSFLGASIALKRGSSFIRVVFLCVVSFFILRLAYEVFQAQFGW